MSHVGLFKRGPTDEDRSPFTKKASPSRLLRCTLHFQNGSIASAPGDRQGVEGASPLTMKD